MQSIWIYLVYLGLVAEQHQKTLHGIRVIKASASFEVQEATV